MVDSHHWFQWRIEAPKIGPKFRCCFGKRLQQLQSKFGASHSNTLLPAHWMEHRGFSHLVFFSPMEPVHFTFNREWGNPLWVSIRLGLLVQSFLNLRAVLGTGFSSYAAYLVPQPQHFPQPTKCTLSDFAIDYKVPTGLMDLSIFGNLEYFPNTNTVPILGFFFWLYSLFPNTSRPI